jgi:hypothetical protein
MLTWYRVIRPVNRKQGNMSQSDYGEPESGRHAGMERVLLGILVALAVIGIAVTDTSDDYGLRYWLIMVPVFAVVSIVAGWSRERRSGEGVANILRRQILHWLGLVLAVLVIYALQKAGRVDKDAVALSTLTLLALTTFLAGVHFDWRMSVLGVAMGLTVVVAALFEKFFLVILVIAGVAGALALFWRRKTD